MLDGTYCLEIKNTPNGAPDVDIIFVHGLASGAQIAWENQHNDLWPMWLGLMMPFARILLLNYPAPALFAGESSRVNIQERARNLANFLPTNGIGNRQTVFVCHSLGGILVKEMLRASIENGCSPRIAGNTVGVIFLASPHLGADLASWGAFMGSQLTKDLARGSDYLKDLQQWFSIFASSKALTVTAYYETQRLRGAIVVDRESANPCCSGCSPIGLDADHSSICKPPSPNSDIFIRLKRDIEMAQANIAKVTTSLTCFEDVLQLPELTNNMYFDVLNLLHRIFAQRSNAVRIISNPGHGLRPCCFIVTKDQAVLKLLQPLTARWPDRFITEAGLVGALTAGEGAKCDVVTTEDVSHSGRSRAVERIHLVAKYFRTAIDINVTTASIDVDYVRVATAAHVLEVAIRRWSESILDSIDDIGSINVKLASGTKRRQTVATKAAAELKEFVRSEEDRKSWLAELINAVYRRNKFTVRLKSFNFDQSEPVISTKYKCRIESTDYLKDVVILVFDKKATRNYELSSWITSNIRSTLPSKRNARTGDLCRSPAFASQQLKIESIDESVFIPLADKVIRMQSVIVLSGAEGKLGSSGSPIYDKEGSLVAMTIGKTIMDAVSLILAIPFDAGSGIAKLLRKRETKRSEPHTG